MLPAIVPPTEPALAALVARAARGADAERAAAIAGLLAPARRAFTEVQAHLDPAPVEIVHGFPAPQLAAELARAAELASGADAAAVARQWLAHLAPRARDWGAKLALAPDAPFQLYVRGQLAPADVAGAVRAGGGALAPDAVQTLLRALGRSFAQMLGVELAPGTVRHVAYVSAPSHPGSVHTLRLAIAGVLRRRMPDSAWADPARSGALAQRLLRDHGQEHVYVSCAADSERGAVKLDVGPRTPDQLEALAETLALAHGARPALMQLEALGVHEIGHVGVALHPDGSARMALYGRLMPMRSTSTG